MLTPHISFFGAIIGGVVPALMWLWFWLREESDHPEPPALIALAFVAGAVAVAIVLPIEQYARSIIDDETLRYIAWSFIEEFVKFAIALSTVLLLPNDDEPIDPVIFMITIALGFAAAENTLFILSPLSGNTLAQTILTGNFRFVGATLLHVLSSAVIGLALAFEFYKSRSTKIIAVIIGILLASAVHAIFNYFIVNLPEQQTMQTFGVVWVGLILLLGTLEYVKRIPKP